MSRDSALSIQRKNTMKNPTSIVVDTSWMQPILDKKIWVEYPPGREEIFEKAILTSFDDQKAFYKKIKKNQVSDNEESKELYLIHERVSDYNDKDQNSKGFDDMVNMEIINDAELLANLAIRYKKNLICTYVGPTLLVVNPFQPLPDQYGEDVKKKYIESIVLQKDSSTSYKDQSPHVYAVAAISFKCLFDNKKNQAIVISGESGAGKTENAKFAMNLLTTIGWIIYLNILSGAYQQNQQQLEPQHQLVGIEEKILCCNPILEAFGNAKTVRNNNSSRFGKYVRMMVSQSSKKIIGATITNYLLEKSRLVAQGALERNFHIFYIFIKGMSAAELEKYYLSTNGVKMSFDDMKYLFKENHEYDVKGIDDSKLYTEIMDTVDVLGVREYLDEILKVLFSILFLGNIDFDDSSFDQTNPCVVKDLSIVQKLSGLLSIPEVDISKSVCYISRSIQGQTIDSPQSKASCIGLRDSWAKAIYGRLFNWLVQKLNETIKPSTEQNIYEVGLLDIYGFEVFEVNGFEQIMINYTNEKLQQLYILYVFKEEEIIFANEGLSEFQAQIKFEDNQQVIDLLEKPKQGIFEILDDSCQVKSDDLGLLENIKKSHGSNVLFDASKISKTTFKIIHTAKEVEYNIQGFREKNLDELSNLVMKISQTSENKLMKALFNQEISKKDKTSSKQIRSSMADLMKDLRSCDVHFIRCIKPNEKKEKQLMLPDYTLNQIRYLGVLATLKVRKLNYPIRRPYQSFYKDYGDLTKNKSYPHLLKENADFRELVIQMFKTYFPTLGPEVVLFGKTKIFLRIQALPIILKKFEEEITQKRAAATKLKQAWKKYKIKCGFFKFMNALKWIKTKMKSIRKKIYYKKQLVHCIRIQKWFRIHRYQKKKQASKIQIDTIQTAFKRFNEISLINRRKHLMHRIQKLITFIIRNKKKAQQTFIQTQLLLAINQAWDIIINKNATKIQKVMKGYLVRKHYKKEIAQIKEAGRQCKMKKIVVKIQKVARGHIVRQGLRKMHRAAYYIQGYFKMRWLSDLFFVMRAKIVVIQHHVRAFLEKKRMMKEKYEKYILPWEKELTRQKLKEENHLFGIGEFIENPEISQPLKKIVFSPFAYRTPSPHRRESQPSPEFQSNLNFEEILSKANNNKLILFGFIVDLEIFLDTSEYFYDSYSKNFKQIFDHVLNNGNFPQTFHVGNTHAFATTSLGNLYSWGMNDTYQLGINKPTLKPVKPFSHPFLSSVRLRQVAAGSDHSLFLTTDGKVFICGSNEQGQQLGRTGQLSEIEFDSKIQQIEASQNSSFAIGENGKLYSWPVGGEEEYSEQIPYEVEMPTQVNQISVGGQFAIILGTNGCLYSFGQNQSGQLGQGDFNVLLKYTYYFQQQTRMKPSIIKGFENIKFSNVSCGLKHAISKTTLGKVYTWGWGEFGQLGNDKFQSSSTPQLVKIELGNVIQVQAGMKCSIILIENKLIYWSGSNGTISYQGSFCKLKIEAKVIFLQQIRLSKCPTLANGNYSPIRLMTSFSRSLSLVSITYVQHNNKWEGQPQVKKNVLKTLSTKWLEQYNTIDPPSIESITKYFAEIHMKLPINNLKESPSLKILKPQYSQNDFGKKKYQKKKEENHQYSKSSLQDDKQYQIEFKSSEPVLVKEEYQEKSIEDLYEQQRQFQQKIDDLRQQNEFDDVPNPLSNELEISQKIDAQSEVIDEEEKAQPDEKMQENKILQDIKGISSTVGKKNQFKKQNKASYKQRLSDRGSFATSSIIKQLVKQRYSPTTSNKGIIQKLMTGQKEEIQSERLKSSGNQSQNQKNQTLEGIDLALKDQKVSQKTQQKQPSPSQQINLKSSNHLQVPKNDLQSRRKKQNQNQNDKKQSIEVKEVEKLSFQNQIKTDYSLDSEIDPEGKIKKLREIKDRLIKIKSVSEQNWTADDQEFLLRIYSQNLNVLLEKIG